MSCLVCGNKELSVFLKTKDYSFSGDSFELKRCDSCKVVVTTPVPNNINKYYNVENYDSFRQKPSLFGLIYGFVQKIKELRIDDDQDAVWLTVDIGNGSSCHVGYRSCFYRSIPLGKIENAREIKMKFEERKKKFDPEKVYKDQPNPTKI